MAIKDGLTRTERHRLKDVAAYRKKKREWARTESQREKRNAYMRVWREKNRDRHNQQARESHQRNKHKHVDRNSNMRLIALFGITLEQKREMVSSQNGLCLICSEPFKDRRSTHVDHCHSTNKIRGILCHRCNTKLGWFERYGEVILKYLGKSKSSLCIWCGGHHESKDCLSGPAHNETPTDYFLGKKASA